MRRPLPLVTLVLLLVLALGAMPGCIAISSTERCGTHKQMKGGEPLSCDLNVRLGDKAMVEGQPEEALRHYASAVSFHPGLAENPEYQKRVGRARAAIAYQEGSQLAEQGRWDVAVLKYIESVGADPSLESAQQSLALARKQAATMHYAKGLELASTSHLAQAVAEFQQALNYDGENEAARAALKAYGPHHGADAPPPPAPHAE